MIKIAYLAAALALPLNLFGDEPLSNVLVYDDGNVQISSEISPYETLAPGAPIQGSVIITHNSNNPVDESTFRIGDKPLKVTPLQSIPMSSNSLVVVSIYSFQLNGMEGGFHTLPSIRVKVGNKEFQAPPLSVQVGN